MCAVNEAAITLANCLQDSVSLPSAKLETPLITIHSIFKSCAAKNRPAKDFVNKASVEVNRVKSWDLSSERSDLSLLSERLKGWTQNRSKKCSFGAKSYGTPLSNRPSRIYIFTGFSEKTLLGWLIFHWVFLSHKS